MTSLAALSFLRSHQPLPDDAELDEDLARQLDLAVDVCQKEKCIAAIPLLMNVFGRGDGFGVYPVVVEALTGFAEDEVVPHIVDALVSPFPGVRYWSAQTASAFPSQKLVAPLATLLKADDADTRGAAATALGQIRDPTARKALEQALALESDDLVRSLIVDAMDNT